MYSLPYLLKLEICGIKNIEKPVTFEFYKRTIANDFEPDNYRIKAIYGENGSGKTAVITAVKVLKELLLNPSYLADSTTQRSLYEIINKKKQSGYIEFEFLEDIAERRIIGRYRISFQVGKDGRTFISSESFDIKNGNHSKNKYKNVFYVDKGNIINSVGSTDFLEMAKKKTANLLLQKPFVHCVLKDMHPDLKKQHFRLLLELLLPMFLVANLYVYLDEADFHDDFFFIESYRSIEQSGSDTFVKEMMDLFKKHALTVRSDEQRVLKNDYEVYKNNINRLCLFLKIFKPELKDIEIDRREDKEVYWCRLKMRYEEYVLDQEFESRGIKKLIKLFDYLDVASSGGIVFIDELDSNINDVFLDKVIEYLMYYGKGQLCFTSHNLSPMSVLRYNKNSIDFISSINTVHTWKKNGNLTPENAYRNGFIEDSPFNTDATDFIGILGEDDE